jgi:hypothetical protein
MIICPNCKHDNMAGTLFCSECGAQLVAKDSLITQHISTGQMDEAALNNSVPRSFPTATGGADAWGSLHLLDTGQVMPLSDRNEFTLGRISEGQPIMPDLDLSPYQAYANGVSRLHAVIKRVGQSVMIMDLGSANGTYVNGRRLTANVEQIVNHGDVIAFGKLKTQVLIKSNL